MTISAALIMGLYAESSMAGGALWDENVDLHLTLHTSGYVPDRANHEAVDDLTNELPTGGGYTAGGVLLVNAETTVYTGTTWPIQWIAMWDFTESEMVRPTVANGFVYRCTASGTSGVGEPVWPLKVGDCVDDAGTRWVCTGTMVVKLDCDHLTPAWSGFTAGPFRHVVISDRRDPVLANQPLIGVYSFSGDQIGSGGNVDIVFSTSGAVIISIP
jgi:hypothetical protein